LFPLNKVHEGIDFFIDTRFAAKLTLTGKRDNQAGHSKFGSLEWSRIFKTAIRKSKLNFPCLLTAIFSKS
jgi:hypothetical protein